MSSRRVEIFSHFYSQIRSNIFIFCKHLGFEPTWQQRQLLEAIQNGEKRIAVRSGQGPGKTVTACVIGLWLLIREKNAKLIVVAPTMAQAKDVWLSQARKLIYSDECDPALRMFYTFTATGIGVMNQKPNMWGALLKTSTKTENAQGQHEENMHVIFEEASGISAEIAEQYKGTLSNPNAVFLQIGNPNTRSCKFFDCFHSRKNKWFTLAWNAEETPETKWFTKTRNEEIADEYGTDSDVYRIRVKGEFPHTDPSAAISFEDLCACYDTDRIMLSSKTDERGNLPRQFGLDFARFGSDENIYFMRQGFAVRKWHYMNHVEPGELVDEAFLQQKGAGWSNKETLYVPDAGGMGQGVLRDFYTAKKKVLEFHTQGTPINRKYADKMTEAYFTVRNLVRDGGLWLPDDSRLTKQLSSRIYFIDKKGRLKIESKEEYKKRGFESPDRAESFVMAFYPYHSTMSRIATRSA